ncbi:cytochrome P450 [Streptosporangium carneum]|uniref:Cytochrome P450 n=1 Tax=Streptosporangium carneum TaxID=47481 RepID=A0A9W6HYS3_9ACTN|nr:cytochrome P450 [Streptosporangium carneum]GLK08865.1 cytochrome P450 [Streptosporangium carneum]
MNTLAEMGRRAKGEVVRLDLGLFRPYLVTHPDHVQQVLRSDWTNYRREGMFWRPLRRMLGAGVLGEDEPWESGRKILQPLFTRRYIGSIAGELAGAITARVEELDEYALAGRHIDGLEEMSRIVNRAVLRVLFGDRITREEGERLAPAYDAAATSINFRLLMPFMPYSVRVPGDRAFVRAVRTVDDVVFPVIRKARADQSEGLDVISALCRVRGDDGTEIDDRRIRDNLVSVYGAASESTAMTLTWLWPILDAHPHVAARLYDEIDRVVGAGPVAPRHLPELRYTRMVLQELLRLYPAGWIFPRMAMKSAEIGGVRVRAGAQVLISPYATHRLDEFWERPLEFDPERFAPEAPDRRHKYSYFPFGGGPHQCLGQHLFYVEAPLLVAALLSRFRPRLASAGPFTPSPAASLRPKEKITLNLVPVRRAAGEAA